MLLGESIGVLCHMQRYFSYICDGTDVRLSLGLLVFYVTRKNISVIYVTTQMCRRTEEVVPTVGLPTP